MKSIRKDVKRGSVEDGTELSFSVAGGQEWLFQAEEKSTQSSRRSEICVVFKILQNCQPYRCAQGACMRGDWEGRGGELERWERSQFHVPSKFEYHPGAVECYSKIVSWGVSGLIRCEIR